MGGSLYAAVLAVGKCFIAAHKKPRWELQHLAGFVIVKYVIPFTLFKLCMITLWDGERKRENKYLVRTDSALQNQA